MRSLLMYLLTLAIVSVSSCGEAPEPQKEDESQAERQKAYAAFEENVAAIRRFYTAHSNRDLQALAKILSDSLQWSPPQYNGNQWLGKDELMSALQAYHEVYDSIRFVEGMVLPNTVAGAYWSGSAFPEGRTTIHPNVIRTYGTWTAIHKASGKKVGLKFYSNTTLNDRGQIISYSDYFDRQSLVPED